MRHYNEGASSRADEERSGAYVSTVCLGALKRRPYKTGAVATLFRDDFELCGGGVYGIAANHDCEGAGFDDAVHVAI